MAAKEVKFHTDARDRMMRGVNITITCRFSTSDPLRKNPFFSFFT